MKRLAVLFVFALTVTACAGGQQAAISVGDDAISRDDYFGQFDPIPCPWK